MKVHLAPLLIILSIETIQGCGSQDETSGQVSSLEAAGGGIANPDPSMGALPLQGGSRLTANEWSGQDGAVYQDGTFFDSQLQQDCKVVLSPDGVLRCLPTLIVRTVAYDRRHFSDSNCTLPVIATSALTTTSQGCKEIEKGMRAVVVSDNSKFLYTTAKISFSDICPFALPFTIMEIGDQITTPDYGFYLDAGNICKPSLGTLEMSGAIQTSRPAYFSTLSVVSFDNFESFDPKR